MKLFLDTANINEIKKAVGWGIIDGITTNPTKLAAEGKLYLPLVKEICTIVDGPVSVEAVSTQAEGIVEEAASLTGLHKNIVVKVPLIKEGIKAIKILSAKGIKTNATLNFSPAQALLAAKVGATYVSPFVGRLDYIGHEGMDIVDKIKKIYNNYGFTTRIIVAAVRSPLHVLQAALAGADVATMTLDILEMLFDHPLTENGLDQFLSDWKKVPK